MRGRAERRHHDVRVKARAARVIKRWLGGKAPDADFIGRMASVHCRPCACWMCQFREPFKDKRLLVVDE